MFAFHHTRFETTHCNQIVLLRTLVKLCSMEISSSYNILWKFIKGHQVCELFTIQLVSNTNHKSYDNKSKHVTLYCQCLLGEWLQNIRNTTQHNTLLQHYCPRQRYTSPVFCTIYVNSCVISKKLCDWGDICEASWY